MKSTEDTTMICFKSCPQCKGDVISLDSDNQLECLQCGYELPSVEDAALHVKSREWQREDPMPPVPSSPSAITERRL